MESKDPDDCFQEPKSFFTEESYKRLTIKPSLERVMKEWYSDTNDKSNEDFLKSLNPDLESPKVGCPYPRKSFLSRSQQRTYLELYHKLSTGPPAQHPSQKELKEIEHFKKYLECSLKRICSVPCYYTLQQTISLKAGAVYKTDSIMRFIQYLFVKDGNKATTSKPSCSSYKSFTRTQGINKDILDKIDSPCYQDLTSDPVIASLVAKHPVDFIVSSEAFLTMLDNHSPHYEQQWEIPFTVQMENSTSKKKVIVINTPLMKKLYLPKVQNTMYHMEALKHFFIGKNTKESKPETDERKMETAIKSLHTSPTTDEIFDFGNENDINKLETFTCLKGNEDKLLKSSTKYKISQKLLKNKHEKENDLAEKTLTSCQESLDSIQDYPDDNSSILDDASEVKLRTNESHESDRTFVQTVHQPGDHLVASSSISSKCAKDQFQNSKMSLKLVDLSDQNKKESLPEGSDVIFQVPKKNSDTLVIKDKPFISDSSDTEHELVIALDSSSNDESNKNKFMSPSQPSDIIEKDSPKSIVTRSRKRKEVEENEGKESHINTNQSQIVMAQALTNTLDGSTLLKSKRLKGICETSQESLKLQNGQQKKNSTVSADNDVVNSNRFSDESTEQTPLSPDKEDRDVLLVLPKNPPKRTSSNNNLATDNSNLKISKESPNCAVTENAPVTKHQECIKQFSGNIECDGKDKSNAQSPSITDEAEHMYSLWSFGKFKILVKSQIDGRSTTDKTQQEVPLHIQPKLEYQAIFGHEMLTVSEVCCGWLKLFLTPGAQLARGRIDVFTSELLKFEYNDLNNVLNPLVPFNPGQSMKMLHSCLKNMYSLSESEYLLSHNTGDLHACIYQNTQPATKSSYDLHTCHQKHHLGQYGATNHPWLPLDTNQPLKQHTDLFRIPATFPPNTDVTTVNKKVGENPTAIKKRRNRKKKNGKL
ncbi:little elongation complex subunit 2-like isoform X2 [Antedon mediterranea]|uniref:little elongation complex subunit 2-like isoform X2 n=1 Tax=Antedon mediterranea TaxID=105859 RepID=UPI003AF5EA5A